MRGGGGEEGVSWKVSGISSWATVGRGPLEVAATAGGGSLEKK